MQKSRSSAVRTSSKCYPSPIAAFDALLRSTTFGIRDTIQNLYLITIDDSPTFVVPNSVFGLSAAMTSSLLTLDDGENPALRSISWTAFGYVVLKVLLFNWTNLLIFDLANQREGSKEDGLNKPWRPIPSGRMTATQMRRWLIFAMPLVLGFNQFGLQVGVESCLLAILTWMYNDLGGGDDNWLLRNWIIACAFGVYNLGSMKVAASSAAAFTPNVQAATSVAPALVVSGGAIISSLGYAWAVLISGVIFTTMHIQDLKDVAGDRARGRRSAPIVLGRRVTSWTIALPILVWSAVCVHFWNAPLPVIMAPILLGMAVAWRCIFMVGRTKDRRTWQLWCAWTAVLYIIPPLSA